MHKVILVTGASSGIGNAIAEYLGKHGHHVYGASRSSVDSKHFTSVKMDVTNKSEVENIITKIFIGEGRIDAVVRLKPAMSMRSGRRWKPIFMVLSMSANRFYPLCENKKMGILLIFHQSDR